MCFSAGASFGSSAVLIIIGVAAIKKTHHSSQLLFASIPLIFGLQQIAEGVLWLTLPLQEYLTIQKIFTHIFIIVAQIIWPIWVPIAVLLLEKNSTRRWLQKVFVVIGFSIGLYLAICLFLYGVEAKIDGQHIVYLQDYPLALRNYGVALYALATIFPPFFSHIKRMWILGLSILVSYVFTEIFYQEYILSVWCFFSSIISISVYGIMIEIEKRKQGNNIIK